MALKIIGIDTLTGQTKISTDNDNIDKGVTYIEQSSQRVLISVLSPSIGAFLLISGSAYFVYLGRVVTAFTPKYVEFQVTTSGAGSQTAEVGFFSSLNPPNKSGQSLSKLVSTNAISVLTSTGVKRNTTAFSTTIAVETFLWAGIRTAMATTQPTIRGLGFDMAQGQILVASSAAALAGAGPWTGALTTVNTSATCPELRAVLD
jgi:hypothetical protein